MENKGMNVVKYHQKKSESGRLLLSLSDINMSFSNSVGLVSPDSKSLQNINKLENNEKQMYNDRHNSVEMKNLTQDKILFENKNYSLNCLNIEGNMKSFKINRSKKSINEDER